MNDLGIIKIIKTKFPGVYEINFIKYMLKKRLETCGSPYFNEEDFTEDVENLNAESILEYSSYIPLDRGQFPFSNIKDNIADTNINTTSSSTSPSIVSLSSCANRLEEIGKKKPPRCNICMNKEANICTLPCSHMAMCIDCTVTIKRSCPICKQIISHIFKVNVIESSKLCINCNHNESNICHIPCKHFGLCRICQDQLKIKNCLICKSEIKYNVDIYINGVCDEENA